MLRTNCKGPGWGWCGWGGVAGKTFIREASAAITQAGDKGSLKPELQTDLLMVWVSGDESRSREHDNSNGFGLSNRKDGDAMS